MSVWPRLLFIGFVGITIAFLDSCSMGPPPNSLTVYTSVDRDYAEPILQAFADANPDINFNPVYDSELTKTTGLFNRIVNERENPQADVFWNSEIIRTIQLKREGLLAPYSSPKAADIPPQFKDVEGYWTGFSARARVMVINTNDFPKDETPTTLPRLGDPQYAGKTAIAEPFFGTTATHMALYYTLQGKNWLQHHLNRIKNNNAKILPGNATVRDEVANGNLLFGMTDTDDVNGALDEGKPVRMAYIDHSSNGENEGIFVIPNTVALIANSHNPENGKKLIDYLLSAEVEAKLAQTRAKQIPVRSDVERPENVPVLNELKPVDVSYEDIADNMEECQNILRTLIK